MTVVPPMATDAHPYARMKVWPPPMTTATSKSTAAHIQASVVMVQLEVARNVTMATLPAMMGAHQVARMKV